MHPFIYPRTGRSIYLSIHPPIYPPIHASIHISIYLSIHLPSIYPSVYPSIYLSTHLAIYVYIYPECDQNPSTYHNKQDRDDPGRSLDQHGPLWVIVWDPWAAPGHNSECIGGFLGIALVSLWKPMAPF